MNMKYLTTIFFLIVILAIASPTAAQGLDSIILVSDNFADSAVADALADAKNIDVVTTPWNEFDESLVGEIDELDPKTIFIIGGPVAVPTEYDEALGSYTIIRLPGKDRFETAASVFDEFRSEFKGKGILIAQGHDRKGIEKAVAKAKGRGALLLFIEAIEIPEEVEEALEDSDDEDVEIESSPDMDEDEIERDIGRIRARLRVRIDRLKDIDKKERAWDQITDANDTINKAQDLIVNRSTVDLDRPQRFGNTAALKLLNQAIKHYDEALTAFDEENYGKAFGQAVAAESLARNSIRVAEHEDEFENKPEEALDKIKNAKDKIQDAYEELEEEGVRPEIVLRTLRLAEEHLEMAENAYDEGRFGAAYAHARIAKRLAQNADETVKHFDRLDRRRRRIDLTIRQDRDGIDHDDDDDLDDDDNVLDDEVSDAISDAEEEILRAETEIAEEKDEGGETSASEQLLEEAKATLEEAKTKFGEGLIAEAEELAEVAEDLASDARMKYLGKTVEELESDRAEDAS
jgi:putative cell wall-binding protein